MKSTRILYLLSIILSIVNLFVVYTTFFTNLFNDTKFSLWYWPGATLIIITLIINLISLFKYGQRFALIILIILNAVLLLIYSAPLLLV